MTQATPVRVFVSHSHADNEFCHSLVEALRDTGADVWYDEHNMGAERLLDAINRELESRSVFIVILSKAAFNSSWVKDECQWAYTLYKRKPNRIILPVTAKPIEQRDFDSWLFLEGFARIEKPNLQPYSRKEAAMKTLQRLGLFAPGEGEQEAKRHDRELADELLARGKVLSAQYGGKDALPFLECASKLAPDNFEIWMELGWNYGGVGKSKESDDAYDKARQISPDRKREVLFGRGHTQNNAGRWDEALETWNKLIALEPDLGLAWLVKGMVLGNIGVTRNDHKAHEQALEMFDHALSLDMSDLDRAVAMELKAKSLRGLGRIDEAKTLEASAAKMRSRKPGQKQS